MTGRLSAPGEHAARARVETIFAAVDRLSAVDIYELAAPSIDRDDRDVRMAELERLADGAGRGDLLDDACEALTNAVCCGKRSTNVTLLAGLSLSLVMRMR